ncbi:MAG: CBS domain-containing protein [Bacteroidota bacterium]
MFDPSSPVSTIMSVDVHHVSPTDILTSVVALIASHGVHHLPVCENGKVVGMLSQYDLNRLEHSFTIFGTAESKSFNADIIDSLIVKDVMTKEVATIQADATIQTAADIFKSSSFHSLVVVEADGKTLKGILTVMDLVHYAYAN